jgi:hypothetical protein
MSGVRRGARKPHFTYTLTDDADRLFPKAYDALLNQLLSVLKGRLKPREIEAATVSTVVCKTHCERSNRSAAARKSKSLMASW